MTIAERDYYEAVRRIAREMSKPKEIDWELCRYEIAKEYFVREVRLQRGQLSAELIAEGAVKLADTLIAELQKSKCQ